MAFAGKSGIFSDIDRTKCPHFGCGYCAAQGVCRRMNGQDSVGVVRGIGAKKQALLKKLSDLHPARCAGILSAGL